MKKFFQVATALCLFAISHHHLHAQSFEVSTLTGYNLSQKRKASQFTPHTWFIATYGNEFRVGLIAFSNTDRINRNWPERGDYQQTRKQRGYGVYCSLEPEFNTGKLRPMFMASIGSSRHEWRVSSENAELQKDILPREDIQHYFAHFGLGVNYDFTRRWRATASLGAGENNVQLGIRYRHEL